MKHYLEFINEVTLRKWDRVAMSDLDGVEFTYARIAEEIEMLHILFTSLGIRQGDKIAICGKNSARWAIAFLAAGTYRAVSVPILYDFTPEAVSSLVEHSECVLLFTDARTFRKLKITPGSNLKTIVNIDDFSALNTSSPESFSDLESRFSEIYPDGIKKEGFHYDYGSLDDLAVINYTSGTTGAPKGVMLSSRSLSANVNYGLENMKVDDGDTSLSMLPLAHMFGLAFEFLYAFCGGSHVYFMTKAPSPTTLVKAFAKVRPFILVTVPLVIEKIVKGKIMPALNAPGVKLLRKIPLLSRFVYAKAGRSFMQVLGGNVKSIPLGGAALNPEVEKLMMKMNIPFTVGYGMTECGPLVAYSDWKEFRRGSCGRELKGYDEVRIDSPKPSRIPGEIQIKGSNVMLGYFKNEEATSASFTADGWLRTGDLGIMSEDGSIYIKGRSKCMILSANGQNIYPEELEAVINGQDGVAESLVVSRKSRLTALVVPTEGAHLDIAGLRQRINALLPSYSKLSDVELMDKPFEHTPKHSIKRSLYK